MNHKDTKTQRNAMINFGELERPFAITDGMGHRSSRNYLHFAPWCLSGEKGILK